MATRMTMDDNLNVRSIQSGVGHLVTLNDGKQVLVFEDLSEGKRMCLIAPAIRPITLLGMSFERIDRDWLVRNAHMLVEAFRASIRSWVKDAVEAFPTSKEGMGER